jgi:hypothetical protein
VSQDKQYFLLDNAAVLRLSFGRFKSAHRGKVPSGPQWRLALGMHSVHDAVGVSEGFLFGLFKVRMVHYLSLMVLGMLLDWW